MNGMNYKLRSTAFGSFVLEREAPCWRVFFDVGSATDFYKVQAR